MNDAPLRTITLDSDSLGGAIGVLASAGASFGLTRMERFVYKALMISVNVAIGSLAIVVLTLIPVVLVMGGDVAGRSDWLIITLGLSAMAFAGSSAVGTVALLANIPLFLRTWRERARLKALGVTALSDSLWRASRRHRWLSRTRSALIVIFGAQVAVLAMVYLGVPSVGEAPLFAAFFAVVAVMLFAARHLRKQREQMDLAANADELTQALQSLRQQAGATGTIAVPAELVERVAKIESAQIAQQRKQAILQSAGSQAIGYAITFDEKAAEQRTALKGADRVALEDQLADLSTAGRLVETNAMPQAPGGTGCRGTTPGGGVEFDYVIDDASRAIRITAVKRVGGEAVRSMAERAVPEPFAIQYSDAGRTSRKELPPDAQAVLFDVVDALADNPDAFPGRTRPISRDGNIRLYLHPRPALQVTFEVDATRKVLYLLHFVAPKVMVTKPVFISYSHKDSLWLDKLKIFLKPLEDRELIRVWDDTEIRPGAEWLAEIRTALESARVAVFLVTQNFVASPFIREQELPALLKAAQDRGCQIFWIAVSSTTFEDSPLAKFQGANPPGTPLDLLSEPEQNKIFTEIYRKMKAAVTVE